MKKFFCVLVFLCLSRLCFATPPTNIELKYDQTTKILLFDIIHPTHNPGEHRIRQVIIFKNNEEVFKKTYPRQGNASLMDQILLDAKAEDVIRLKAICNQAGSKEEELVVVKDESVESK